MGQYQITNVPKAIHFECGRETTHRTLQNVQNLLLCRMGEIPYDRYRGFDTALFDLPMSALEEALMPEIDRVLLWEPNAEAVSASCRLDEKGQVLITVTVDVDEREEARQ